VKSLVLKLIATPGLIGAASLAGRRWGPAVGGSLVGLPLTSGPIVLFLALDHGAGFAAASALGTLAGTASEAAFVVAYAWLALRLGWPSALAGGTLAFAATTYVLQFERLPVWPLTACVVAALFLALKLMPRLRARRATVEMEPPSWDLPARMAAATAFVLLLTALAARLGPQLTGLLSPFPLYAGVLAGFAHAEQGAAAALQLLRGVLLGMFAFVGFFSVISLALVRDGLVFAFASATVAALVLQGASLWVVRGRRAVLGN
jgi:hypothetical protein